MKDMLGLHDLYQQCSILVYRATMGDRLYEGMDWLLPLSRRYSWHLLYSALGVATMPPRSEDVDTMQILMEKAGGISRVIVRPFL